MAGCVCYQDEVVEARKDIMVVTHSSYSIGAQLAR
jgi:hypothetical protein